jgi:hypothetical protein
MEHVEGELAAVEEMFADAAETGQLIVVGQVVEDGAKRCDDQREAFGQPRAPAPA